MVGIILKAIFFYFAFVFVRNMIRGYFNFKVLKEQAKAGSFEGYSSTTQASQRKKDHDFSRNEGKIVEAEFEVLNDK